MCSMTVSRLIPALLVVLTALAIACGGGGPTATPTLTPRPTPGTTATAPSPTTAPTGSATTVTTPPSGPASLSFELYSWNYGHGAITHHGSYWVGHHMASGQVAPGQDFTLDVRLSPRGRGISGVQFDLHFPPEQLEVLEARPGTLLGSGPLEIKQPGDEPGVYLYVAARIGETVPPTRAGLVATLKLRVLDAVATGTVLQMSLQEVILSDQDVKRVQEVVVDPPLELVVEAS